MGKWSGRYDDTYEADRSLEDDIEEAGQGRFCYPTSSGGTVRESDDRIDVYGSSDSAKGHSHSWYNAKTGDRGHHD